MVNCNKCKFINITEKEQVDKRVNHLCLVHEVKLFHKSGIPNIEHDFIHPCECCGGLYFQEK